MFILSLLLPHTPWQYKHGYPAVYLFAQSEGHLEGNGAATANPQFIVAETLTTLMASSTWELHGSPRGYAIYFYHGCIVLDSRVVGMLI